MYCGRVRVCGVCMCVCVCVSVCAYMCDIYIQLVFGRSWESPLPFPIIGRRALNYSAHAYVHM